MPEIVHKVGSIDEEDTLLGICECGTAWTLAAEVVVPIGTRWLDALVVRCLVCDRVRRALFDITEFFHPKGTAWTRA